MESVFFKTDKGINTYILAVQESISAALPFYEESTELSFPEDFFEISYSPKRHLIIFEPKVTITENMVEAVLSVLRKHYSVFDA